MSDIGQRFRASIYPADDANVDGGCPNGPDEDGNWPCDPKGYFGVLECQVCGRIGVVADRGWPGQDDPLYRQGSQCLHDAGYASLTETFEAGGKERE